MDLQQSSPSLAILTESGFLVQSGSTLNGEVVLASQTPCPGLGSAQGTLTGSNVSITVDHSGQRVILTGTAAADGSSMKGSYSLLANTCSSGSASGIWNARPVKPVSGNYLALFTSNSLGLVYNYSLKASQGPNVGASVATLSGTMTSSTSPCASDVSITGVIGGTSIVFSIFASNGTPLGQFTGTTSFDATTLVGTYSFSSSGNVCSGDKGTVSATLQPS